jgi:hypothetical protein
MALVCEELEQINKNELLMREEDMETLHVSFLCVSFLRNTLITCGDDGFLYLWEDA